jgi:hypothetical protein
LIVQKEPSVAPCLYPRPLALEPKPCRSPLVFRGHKLFEPLQEPEIFPCGPIDGLRRGILVDRKPITQQCHPLIFGVALTSDQHPWFKQARKDPDSKYRDWVDEHTYATLFRAVGEFNRIADRAVTRIDAVIVGNGISQMAVTPRPCR